MPLGCRLTSVRGNRGENYEMNLWFSKNIQRKKSTVLLFFPLERREISEVIGALYGSRWQEPE
jgi:hypothetical protein